MKKTLNLSAVVIILFFASCKKENTFEKSITADQQVELLIAKYPNLKLVTTVSDSQNFSELTLKNLDDSLSKFSKLLTGVSVSKALLTTNTQAQINSFNLSSIPKNVKLSTNDYGETDNQYQWSAYKNVGSSDLGYFQVTYSASIGYQTNNSTGTYLNYINSVVGLNSSAPNSSLTDGSGNYYSFSYTAGSSLYAISTDKSTVQFTFSGKANFVHTYYPRNTGGGASTPVVVASASNYPISNSVTLNSASFPLVYPIVQ